MSNNKQFVLAITGSAGSGKSTVAEKLAKQLEQCVNIDADHIKHMIVSGFYKDDKNAGGWSFNQWGLVGDSIGLLTHNFLDAGYSVIINGYIDQPAWDNIEKQVTISRKVLLLPNPDTAIQRDAGRAEDVQMGGEAIREHHNHFSNSSFYDNFTKIDTTGHTVEETVKQIADLV